MSATAAPTAAIHAGRVREVVIVAFVLEGWFCANADGACVFGVREVAAATVSGLAAEPTGHDRACDARRSRPSEFRAAIRIAH